MINNIDNGYASVLFDLAKKQNKLEYYFELFKSLLKMLESDNELVNTLADLSIDKQVRKQLVQEIFPDSEDELLVHFLWAVIDFGRMHEIVKITKLFLQLCQKHYHIDYVKVVSTYKLTDAEIKELETALKTKLNLNKIEINNEIDESLIGGIKIKSNAFSIDDTLKTRLELMKTSSNKIIKREGN